MNRGEGEEGEDDKKKEEGGKRKRLLKEARASLVSVASCSFPKKRKGGMG